MASHRKAGSAFAARLSSLKPQTIGAFLQQLGWRRTPGRSSQTLPIETWSKAVGKARNEVVLPTSEEVRDYTIRLEQLFNELAAVEDTPREELVARTEQLNRDIVRFTYHQFDASFAGVSVRAANVCITVTHALLVIAAEKTAASARHLLPTVQQFVVDALRPGSVVIALSANTINRAYDAVGPRIVLARLSVLLSETESEQDQSYSRYDQYVLEAARAARLEIQPGSEITVDFEWSPLLPPPNLPLQQTLSGLRLWRILEPNAETSVARQRLPIEAAAEPPRPETITLTGEVVGIERDPRRGLRSARILTDVNGRRATVVAYLSTDQYERAIEAHIGQQPLTLTGSLARRGNRWVLTEVAEVAELTE